MKPIHPSSQNQNSSDQNTASQNTKGAVFMMLSMAGFVLNDTIMKIVLAEIPLFQAIAIRGVFAIVFMALFCWQQGAFNRLENGLNPMSMMLRWSVFLRTAGEVGGTYFFLTALTYLPIANVTAVLQMLPLTITLAAALFFGEKVGWRRYGAIIIGFIGVLMIIRPGPTGFDLYAIYAFIAMLCITVRDMATRSMPPQTPSLLVSLMTAAAIFVFGFVGMIFEAPATIEGAHVALLALAASIIIMGYLFSVLSMRHGEVSFVAPFRYSILIWALFLGYFVFGDVPDFWASIGSIIVVASGLFTFYRERAIGSGLSGTGDEDISHSPD